VSAVFDGFAEPDSLGFRVRVWLHGTIKFMTDLLSIWNHYF